MVNRPLVVQVCLVFAVLSMVSAVADAQWVMIGRKVIGRVTTLVKEHDDTSPGYEVASVILVVALIGAAWNARRARRE